MALILERPPPKVAPVGVTPGGVLLRENRMYGCENSVHKEPPVAAHNETEGYRGVWEWEMGRVCFRFLVRGFSFSRCHSYSKAGAGAKAEASDMLLVWHLRVINKEGAVCRVLDQA